MKTCENCKWYAKRVYHAPGEFTCTLRKMIYKKCIGTCTGFERKIMSIREAYEVLQAEWVKLYNVRVGDTVKVLRAAKTHELGWKNSWPKGNMCVSIGETLKVMSIDSDILLYNGYGYPFFCLELVKKAEPVIEITCKVNGKTVPFGTLSKETILNIRRES